MKAPQAIRKGGSKFALDLASLTGCVLNVGESHKKTQVILALAEGCVLLINEGYVLDDQLYEKQVLDTIVEKVLGAPGEDIAVVLIEYDEKQMSKMLRDQNANLAISPLRPDL